MNLGFRSVVQILFIGLLVLTVTVVAAMGYHQARSGVVDAGTRVIDAALDKIRERTLDLLESAQDRLAIVGQAFSDVDVLEERSVILRSLWEINRQSPYIESAFLIDAQGNFLEARNAPNAATRAGFMTENEGLEDWVYRDDQYRVLARIAKRLEWRPLESDWFARTRDRPERWISDLGILPVSGRPGFTLTQPLIDRQGRWAGVLGVHLPLEALNRFVSVEGLGQDTILMIIDSMGRVLAQPSGLAQTTMRAERSDFLTVHDLRQNWLRDAWLALDREVDGQATVDAPVQVLDLQTGRFFAQKKSLLRTQEAEWSLMLLLPEFTVLSGVNRGLHSSVTLAIIMQIVAAYIIFVTTSQLTRPLRQMVHNAQVLEDLRFEELRPVRADYSEFRALDAAMQRMTASLLAFNRYVPTNLVRRLLAERHEVKLGAESRKMVLINTGINGFSRIGAMMVPREQAAYLNRYQGEIFEAIRRNGGLVDKFIDDRVIGFWGAPDAAANDAYRACCAALECQVAIHQLNQLLRWENSPAMTVRVGLHQDFCMVGNFGSEDRMFYSVVGKALALNYWLGNLNKRYGTTILASEAVREATAADFVWRWVDEAEFYDGHTRMRVYELCGYANDPDVLQRQEYISRYEAALHFRLDVGNYAEAMSRFLYLRELYPDDKAILLQIESLEHTLAESAQADGNSGGGEADSDSETRR
jgi:adenylate cyclase